MNYKLTIISFISCTLITCSDEPISDTSRLETDTPNVVLILADDLAFSDLGAYGSEIETPHLDVSEMGSSLHVISVQLMKDIIVSL